MIRSSTCNGIRFKVNAIVRCKEMLLLLLSLLCEAPGCCCDELDNAVKGHWSRQVLALKKSHREARTVRFQVHRRRLQSADGDAAGGRVKSVASSIQK